MTTKFDKLAETITEGMKIDKASRTAWNDLKKSVPKGRWRPEHRPRVIDPVLKRLKKDKKQGRKPITDW